MFVDKALKVRLARIGDLVAVCGMIRALAKHHGDDAFVTPETLAALTMGPRPAFQLIVADLCAEPVGYGALTEHIQLQSGQKTMDVQHLFVIPQLRGQGVGAALIDGARREAQLAGCVRLTIGTAPGNGRAAALYRRLGFQDRPAAGARLEMAV